MTGAHPGWASQHAGAVLVGERGVLIRGRSGSGKSSLALALVAAARAAGRQARLVADDRTLVRTAGGRLLARPVPAIAGLVERRGLGLTPEPFEPCVVLRLVVECLGEEPERLPAPEEMVTVVEGVTLPQIRVFGRAADAALVLAALEVFDDGIGPVD